jgi:hypothetical protein
MRRGRFLGNFHPPHHNGGQNGMKVATMPPIAILRRSTQNQALPCVTLPNTVLQPDVQQEDEDERENDGVGLWEDAVGYDR